MNSLLECLAPLAGRLTGSVLHVGEADVETLSRYLELGAQRVHVLVPTEEDAQSLQQACRDSRVGIEPTLVAPRAGRARWYQVNLPAMSGLLEPARLKDYYPRLAVVGGGERAAIDLGQAIGVVQMADAQQHLLVVNFPGVEAALVESVTADQLAPFTWVALRGAREGLYRGAAPLSAAEACLGALGYRTAGIAEDAEPLWPAALYEFDASAREVAKLRAEADGLREHLRQEQASSAESAKQAANLSAQVAELQRKLNDGEQARARVQQDAQALRQALDEQQQHGEGRAQEASRLEAEKARLEQALHEQQTQISALTKERAALTAARDEQAKVAMERQAQLASLGQEKVRLEKLAQERQAQVEALTKERTALATARDEQVKLAAERQARIEALTREKEELAKAHEERGRIAAERQGQIDALTKEKAALAAARDEQSRLAAERQAQLTSLSQEKARLEKLAQERQAQVDALTKDKSTLSAARDEQSKLAVERQRRITQLEAELNDLGGRQSLLQEELLKAEAQIELIADVLLREQLK
jgi:hypothetical protein